MNLLRTGYSATRWWINKDRNNDQKLYSLMTSKFKMVTIINCWEQETSGLRAELNNSGYERENKRADGQIQFMREKLRGPSRNRQCCFWVSWGPESNSGYRNIVGLPRQWSRSLLSGTTSGFDDGCTRVVHEITEWRSSGALGGCTRVRSGARVMHEITEWCMSLNGARE